ncbi:MAG: S8 family serine peptidase, partial [Rheinheimera sp.]
MKQLNVSSLSQIHTISNNYDNFYKHQFCLLADTVLEHKPTLLAIHILNTLVSNMKQIRKPSVAVTVLIALTACDGGSDGSSKKTIPMLIRNNAPVAISDNVPVGKSWLPQRGSFKASDTDGDHLAISDILEDGKSVAAVNGVYTLKSGTLSVKGLDYVYTPLSGQANKLQFVVSDGTLTGRADLEISAALSDPLAEQQWHLRNTGQKAYALGPGLFKYQVQQLVAKGLSEAEATKQVKTQFAAWEKALVAGEDMNVAGAYSQGVTGQNTIAVVVDQGLEIAHEDLEANVLSNRSLNFREGGLNPTDPTYNGNDGDHGTSVAGLIAAVGWNGKGGRGVAPETKLIGMNFLEAQGDLGYYLAHGLPGSGISVEEPIAVFNRSYGETNTWVKSYSEIEESLHEFSATRLRGAKGAVSIKASGNSFYGEHPLLEGNFCDEGGAVTQGLTCFNANMEATATSPYYFVVGAVNSDGKHTSYSTAGANLLVVAPAGESGDKSPAMITTDQMTCLRGYSSFAADDFYTEHYGPDYFKAVHPFDYPG